MFCSTLVKMASLLAITVSALPNNGPSLSCNSFTDDFENLKPLPAGDVPVGVYNGVTYQAFNARPKNAVTGNTGGIIPHSGSNDIVTGIRQDALQLGSVTLNPFANIIASPSKAFNLDSFWFGCSANLQTGGPSEPVACVLSAIGFNIAGQELPVATFSYSPQSPLSAPMVEARLPDYYKGLKNFTVGIASSTTTPAVTNLWVDDVTHCNYS